MKAQKEESQDAASRSVYVSYVAILQSRLKASYLTRETSIWLPINSVIAQSGLET